MRPGIPLETAVIELQSEATSALQLGTNDASAVVRGHLGRADQSRHASRRRVRCAGDGDQVTLENAVLGRLEAARSDWGRKSQRGRLRESRRLAGEPVSDYHVQGRRCATTSARPSHPGCLLRDDAKRDFAADLGPGKRNVDSQPVCTWREVPRNGHAIHLARRFRVLGCTHGVGPIELNGRAVRP